MSEETSLKLEFSSTTHMSAVADTRVLAVFVYAKLIQAGVDRGEAKSAVESIFNAGRLHGAPR